MRDRTASFASSRMPRAPAARSLVASFRGWNDGGHGASLAGAFLARAWGAEQFADIDPERFFDFQLDAAAGLARRGRRAPDRLARERVPPRPARAAAQRRRAAARERAEPALAHVLRRSSPASRSDLGVELVVTLGSLLADVPHTRPAPGHRERERPGARRAARRPGLPLRGPDRDRRRPARRLPRRGHPVGVALGGGAALRLDDAVAAGGKGALRPARRAARRPARHERARRPQSDVYMRAGERGGRGRRGHGRVRRGAREPRRRVRGRGRPPVRRRARRRADALPARARRGRAAATRSPRGDEP